MIKIMRSINKSDTLTWQERVTSLENENKNTFSSIWREQEQISIDSIGK